MNRRIVIVVSGAAFVLAATGFAAYRLGMRTGAHGAASSATSSATSSAARPAAETGRKVLYWHDPMTPGQRFDKSGKSPYMDMDLVPVYADEGQASGRVAVDPGVRQSLGIRVAEVRRGTLARTLDAVGNVAFDERDLVQLQARSGGFVEKVFVRAPLDPVRKGQPLLQLLVPDWVAAQEEYLAIRRMPAGADTAGLLDAAVQRMRLAGMTEAQVAQVTARSRVSGRITVSAPIDGVVSELAVREGMTVAPGTPLFRINGLRSVWVNAEVPESAAAQVRPGMIVRADSPAFPGAAFDGKVEALLPEVSATTRTLKARIALKNPGGKLVPGMFATVHMTPGQAKETLLVPAEAVIQTGRRTVVITLSGDGKFAPADIVTGAEADGRTEVLEGLREGQKVVASGQFLIDSEASLRGALQRLDGAAPPVSQAAAPAPAATHRAAGTVEEIARDEVMISHGAIPTLKWPPMTMGFAPPPGGLPKGIKVGDAVKFEIRAEDDGTYRIVSITRGVSATPGAAK